MRKTYPINKNHQNIIYRVALNALHKSPRLSCFRFDLRYSLDLVHLQNDGGIISRFVDSLKAKVSADLNRKSREYKRKMYFSFDYVWVREVGRINKNQHFHFLLFLSKDAYSSFGRFDQVSPKSLSRMIKEAWASALGVHCDYFDGMVHFGDSYHLYKAEYQRAQDYITDLLGHEIHYLAKEHSKVNGYGNNIGHSQILYV